MDKTSKASRRSFFRAAGALAGGAAGALVAGQAQAFRLVPADDYAGMIENACVSDERTAHLRLLAEVQKELGIKLNEREAEDLLRQISCPSCGCDMLTAYQREGMPAF